MTTTIYSGSSLLSICGPRIGLGPQGTLFNDAANY
jgi:hypothetical protein